MLMCVTLKEKIAIECRERACTRAKVDRADIARARDDNSLSGDLSSSAASGDHDATARTSGDDDASSGGGRFAGGDFASGGTSGSSRADLTLQTEDQSVQRVDID